MSTPFVIRTDSVANQLIIFNNYTKVVDHVLCNIEAVESETVSGSTVSNAIRARFYVNNLIFDAYWKNIPEYTDSETVPADGLCGFKTNYGWLGYQYHATNSNIICIYLYRSDFPDDAMHIMDLQITEDGVNFMVNEYTYDFMYSSTDDTQRYFFTYDSNNKRYIIDWTFHELAVKRKRRMYTILRNTDSSKFNDSIGYILESSVAATDFKGIRNAVKTFIYNNLSLRIVDDILPINGYGDIPISDVYTGLPLDVYVNGASEYASGIASVCAVYGIPLSLWYYNETSRKYVPQRFYYDQFVYDDE